MDKIYLPISGSAQDFSNKEAHVLKMCKYLPNVNLPENQPQNRLIAQSFTVFSFPLREEISRVENYDNWKVVMIGFILLNSCF